MRTTVPSCPPGSVVDVGGAAGVVEEAQHGLEVTVAGCIDQGGATLGVGDGGVGPPVEQQPHHGGAASRARPKQCGVPMVILLVQDRPLVEQPPHDLLVALSRREVQGGRAVGPISGVEQARVLPRQPLHLSQVARLGSTPDPRRGARSLCIPCLGFVNNKAPGQYRQERRSTDITEATCIVSWQPTRGELTA
jgi:hypothetical protein